MALPRALWSAAGVLPVRVGLDMMEPCTLVLFGASGDLTQRMVMPAIFNSKSAFWRGFMSTA